MVGPDLGGGPDFDVLDSAFDGPKFRIGTDVFTGTPVPPPPSDGRLGGIGAPPGWAETRAQLLADAAAADEAARAALTERVREAIEGISDDGHERTVAAVAVGVFVEWLRNPPERVVQVDGSESVRYPWSDPSHDIGADLRRVRDDSRAALYSGALDPKQCDSVSRDHDRCALPAFHGGKHVAVNAAGAVCLDWG